MWMTLWLPEYANIGTWLKCRTDRKNVLIGLYRFRRDLGMSLADSLHTNKTVCIINKVSVMIYMWQSANYVETTAHTNDNTNDNLPQRLPILPVTCYVVSCSQTAFFLFLGVGKKGSGTLTLRILFTASLQSGWLLIDESLYILLRPAMYAWPAGYITHMPCVTMVESSKIGVDDCCCVCKIPWLAGRI